MTEHEHDTQGHAMCRKCWERLQPVVAYERTAAEEFCCFCGALTEEGVFVRAVAPNVELQCITQDGAA